MPEGYKTFGNNCETWSSDCNPWIQCLFDVIPRPPTDDDLVSGARNPQEYDDLYADKLEKYQEQNPDKKENLIQIYVKCFNKKFEKDIKVPENKVNITVKDVDFIVDTLKEVGVDVKNIKNYTDKDINDRLS